jgi:iron complex outermembrane receptor protein
MAAILAALLLLSALPPPAAAAEDEAARESVLTETVTVTEARMPDNAQALDRVPANVTVIDRERIERAGAATLQELLALEAGVLLYDQVGNGLEKTLDLRGFSEGSGTRVFLDGAPLNDPRNNTLALHLVPLEALARIEIRRGPAGALAGGGAQGGVVNLQTVRGEDFGGSLSIAAGSDATSGYSAELRDGAGMLDYSFAGSRESTDGFRENGGGDLRRLSGTVGLNLSSGRRLQLSFLDSVSKLGNPGALTGEELAADRHSAPFNLLDFADDSFSQTTLNFRGALGEHYSLAANLFYRDREMDSLATGRAGHAFQGSYMEADTSALGSVVQLTHKLRLDRFENDFSIGVEYLEGETGASGYGTPVEDLGFVDPAALSSRNIAERHTAALYFRESWHPSADWSLTAGLRFDSDRVAYIEILPTAGYRDDKGYSELSVSAGLNRRLTENLALYASYGEAFLPPTVEELFSFPLFGSNDELQPEDTRSWEVGFRGRFKGGLALDTALFLTETVDEIVFDPDAPQGLFGANVNAGETRRKGIEISLRGKMTERLGYFANATLLDAEFRAGELLGNEVPLVPGERYAAGLDLRLSAGIAFRAELLHVGQQVLDNDDMNERQPLAAYTVVDAGATWELPHAESLALFFNVTNLFDREYATRAIFAYDFLADPEDPFPYDDFFTPAPGRRLRAGARWKF